MNFFHRKIFEWLVKLFVRYQGSAFITGPAAHQFNMPVVKAFKGYYASWMEDYDILIIRKGEL